MATAQLLFNLRRSYALRMAMLALVLLCATGVAVAQTCSGMSLGNNASLNGFVPFPSTNVWNTNIASAPLDPNSDEITSVSSFAGQYLHHDFWSDYGMPYVVVDSTITPSVPINVIDYASESDVVVAPYPATAPIEGYPADCSGWPDTYVGDAHVLLLDRAKCFLYETYNTHRCNGLYNSSSETIWDMTNYETRPWGWTSADAAGLPIFPGLVRYDEIASGAINHAIRFTMLHTKDDANGGYFVYPASHAAGNIWGAYNVMGMRIRLKAGFDISGFSPVNQIILTAMKQYGMILADNGGYFYFQGVADPRWDDNDLDNLDSIASSNFEVVQMTPEFPGYDAATAPTGAVPAINSYTASASTVSSSSPVTFSYNVSGDSYDFIDMIGPVAAGSGSVTINPTATQTYTLNSTNAYGRTTSTPLTVSVNQIPSITWTTPAAIAYGTALSATQLNASSTVAGTFAYLPLAGTVLTAGTHTLSVIFTPTDTTDYTTANGSVTLSVNSARLTVTAVNISKIVGTANPTFTASYSGFVNGDTAAVLSGSPALSTTATTASPVGTYPIAVAQGTLTAANYTFTFVPGTLNVVAAPTIVLTTSAPLSGSASAGYTATVTVTNNGSGAASNVTLTGAALGSVSGTPLPQTLGTLAAGGGTATVTVNFPGSAGANGAAVVEKISGSYTGGTFSASVHATLP